METIKFILKFLTFLQILSLNIKLLSAVPIDESSMKPRVMYLKSDLDEGSFVKIMSNATYTCSIKFDCNKEPSTCVPDLDIAWLIPRELVEHQLIYGKSSSRLHFSKQNKYYINNFFVVKSEMTITDVGSVHNGVYTCSHDLNIKFVAFSIPVRGRDKRGECNVDDHCLSGNCFQQQCKCDPNQVYVSANDQCYSVSDYEGSCTHDQQCDFKLGKGSAVCLNGRCACNKGHTIAALALIGKMCLKIVPLNAECRHTDQCTKNDVNSFCSVKNRCECKTGFHMIDNKCKPFAECDSSQLGNNNNYSRGTCDVNMWCSKNICLCRPNYKLNEKGDCISTWSDNNNEMWYEKYGYYIIGVLAAFLLMALFMIAFQVKRFKQQTRIPVTQTSSRDHLNAS